MSHAEIASLYSYDIMYRNKGFFYKIKLIHFQATWWIDYDKLSFADIH